jgi:uncharacterized protein YbjT (DUF2867 family)
MRTAIVIGATGLVGKCIVKQLLEHPDYEKVVALVRRTTGVQHPKYEEHIVDFDHPETFADRVRGDVLFSALGTTRGQVGSVEAQRKVDYTYQLEVARLAANNGVGAYVLCSAASANASSWLAYSKMKGELDRDVQQLGFGSVQIVRPGLLLGNREKPRMGEKIGEVVVKPLAALFRSLRPIHGETVARAMINGAQAGGTHVYEPVEVFTLAGA